MYYLADTALLRQAEREAQGNTRTAALKFEHERAFEERVDQITHTRTMLRVRLPVVSINNGLNQNAMSEKQKEGGPRENTQGPVALKGENRKAILHLSFAPPVHTPVKDLPTLITRQLSRFLKSEKSSSAV